ncbi:MAG TPA: hypothetical protein VER12_15960 [Polyangiaceae bacterium]|nr:hypothetical protein [Polyangiaceae bacterium]
MRAILFPVLGFLWISALPAAAQTDMERATARETADAGRTQFEAGRYAEAIDSFTRAQQLVAAPPHLLYIARAQAKLGRLVEAHENYLKITRDSLPPKPPKAFIEAVNAAERELEAVDARLPYVTIAVQGAPAAGVTVSMDGTALPAAMVGIPLPVNPGTHAFEARGTAAQSAPVSVNVSEGAKETVMLTLRANSAARPAQGASGATSLTSESPPDTAHGGSSGLRVASYVAFGVGAVGLGVGSYFLVKSSNTRQPATDLYDSCTPNCTVEQQAEIETTDSDADQQRNIGIGAVVTGGVAAITGLTLFLLSASNSAPAAQSNAPRVTPVIGLGSLGLSGTF